MNSRVQMSPLDPEKHQDGVQCFLDYFALSPRGPGIVFLQEILEQFAHLPYENLSKIISLNQSEDWNRPRLRLPETVIREHIERRLGGTCFSLTFYLQTILTQCGFRCYPVMADMRAGCNLHCCLIVLLDGTKFLVDPGYLLTRPMEINPEKPYLYRSEFAGIELRFEARTRRYHLSTFTKQESKWRYSFQDRPVPPEEFLQHWLHSFRRNAMHGLCLTRVTAHGLLYVQKTFMRETTFTGKRNMNIKKNYHAVLKEHFGIDKELVEQARVALQENLARERELGWWRPKRTATMLEP